MNPEHDALFAWARQVCALRDAAGDDPVLIEQIRTSARDFVDDYHRRFGQPSPVLRAPPSSERHEGLVLAALLGDENSDACAYAIPLLRQDSFYNLPHRDMFTACVALLDSGQPLSQPVVEQSLTDLNKWGDRHATAMDAINELVPPSRGDLEGAVKVLRDLTARRALIKAVMLIGDTAFDPDGRGVNSLIADALAQIETVANWEDDTATAPPVRTTWKGEAPIREWLIPAWLPRGRLVLFVGEGGRGKSRLALQLAACIATGTRTWLPGNTGDSSPPPLHPGRKPDETDLAYVERRGLPEPLLDPATVVVWSAEDELEEIHRRLRSIDQDSGIDVSRLEGRLHAVSAMKSGPLWAHSETDEQQLGVVTPHGKWLMNYCERVDARLLIVDPLVAAFACNENDRAQTRRFANAWGSWAMETSTTMIIVAHPPKTSGAEYSGNSDWQAAVRAMWSFGLKTATGKSPAPNAKTEPLAPRLHVPKSNYGDEDIGTTFWIRRQHGLWRATDFENAVARSSPPAQQSDTGPRYASARADIN